MGYSRSSEERLQHEAVTEWWMRGDRSREVVGLAVGDYWFRMDNALVHDGSSGSLNGVGAFEVADADVRDALLSLGGSSVERDAFFDEGRKIVLWHSHVRTVEPSEHDLMHLPEWCMLGRVFHAPSRTTTEYIHACRASNITVNDFQLISDS